MGRMDTVGCMVLAERRRTARVKENVVIGSKASKKERAQGKMWTILNVRCYCCFMDSEGSNGF